MLRFTGGWAPEDRVCLLQAERWRGVLATSWQESFNIEYLEIPNTGAGGEDLVGPSGSGPKGLGFHPDRCRHAEAVELGMLAGLRITAVPLVHGIPDWGYILKELDRPGKLDAAKAQKLGIPRNSLMGRLKQGEAVTLDDGRVVLPEQVLGPEIPGRSFAVLQETSCFQPSTLQFATQELSSFLLSAGTREEARWVSCQDTSDASSAIKACHHANCVIHEATFEAAMEEDALRKGHSTSVMAARFTAACEASSGCHLVFTTSMRTDGFCQQPLLTLRAMGRHGLAELWLEPSRHLDVEPTWLTLPGGRCRASAFLESSKVQWDTLPFQPPKPTDEKIEVEEDQDHNYLSLEVRGYVREIRKDPDETTELWPPPPRRVGDLDFPAGPIPSVKVLAKHHYAESAKANAAWREQQELHQAGKPHVKWRDLTPKAVQGPEAEAGESSQPEEEGLLYTSPNDDNASSDILRPRKRLILSHFSARYAKTSDGESDEDPAEKLGLEAREILGEIPVTVAQERIDLGNAVFCCQELPSDDKAKIVSLVGREVVDSRGNPTVEAELTTGYGTVRAIVPSGASTGIYEALELRDGGRAGVTKAVSNINRIIAPKLKGKDVRFQKDIDDFMVQTLDGSQNEWGYPKSKLGANAILAVSMAVCRAGAEAFGLQLFEYIGELKETKFEVEQIDFMIAPTGAKSFKEALQIGSEVYHSLQSVVKQKYGKSAAAVGDEGGFAPNIQEQLPDANNWMGKMISSTF
eukprot:g7133.t1